MCDTMKIASLLSRTAEPKIHFITRRSASERRSLLYNVVHAGIGWKRSPMSLPHCGEWVHLDFRVESLREACVLAIYPSNSRVRD